MNYIPVPEENIDGPLGIKYPMTRKEKMSRVFNKNYNYEIDDDEEEDDEI